MRLTFLTACLEPGKDGVGDYTRDLATACIRLGHPSTVIALNDRYLAQPETVTQEARGTGVPCLRLPASAAWTERSAAALRSIREHDPDWMSLQFVPYSYNPKGIPWQLGAQVSALVGRRPLHVMFHELWIGIAGSSPLLERAVGFVQRLTVLGMLKKLNPAVMHTSNLAYQQILATQECRSQILPLCGSIPIAEADPGWLDREFETAGMRSLMVGPRDSLLCLGLFGSLHPEWVPEPLFSHVIAAAGARQQQAVVISIGRIGPGRELWERIKADYGNRFLFLSLGERDREDISRFLQHLDFGIATTPWPLIGKSATAVAMLEHGVPVIVTRDGTIATDAGHFPGDPLLLRLDSELPRRLVAGIPRRPARDRLTSMAQSFIADLKQLETGDN